MSKIGKKPIAIPTGVDVTINGSTVSVKGPKGELERTIPSVFVLTVDADGLSIAPPKSTEDINPIWGLERALLKNMIQGVSQGFEEILELNGVGYKAVPKGNDLEMTLGFSHTILFKIPEGVKATVEKNIVKINGISREAVGSVAAKLRALKTPEPYKGHGVKYAGEVIKIKAGKKAAASA